MLYRTPYWLRMLAGRGLTWEMPGKDRHLYITFDDGPQPETTPRILEQLAEYDAKATFFCVGENVKRYPGLYRSILGAGHAVGNHGYNHLNGWETATRKYVENTEKCHEVVKSRLFRPPYGKMKPAQRKLLREKFSIIMWTVLSRDYDQRVDAHTCLEKSWEYTRPGAIVVFHDHEKTISKLEYVLPAYLGKANENGYSFQVLDQDA